MDNVQLVAEKLLKNGDHITFAESCTAGLCAARFCDIPNISHIFDESIVTYANEAKINRLGVNPDTIEQYGVVSEAVAQQMAIGAAKRTGAHVAVGISGIAGPGGGSAQKPVGTVCFGFVIRDRAFAITKHFGDIGRNAVRNASVDTVYEILAKEL